MKGDFSNFNNQRNIHTKDYIPKLFKGIVVDKSKDKIVETCSKFQFGGLPKHRAQEHLFCVKNVLLLCIYCSICLFSSKNSMCPNILMKRSLRTRWTLCTKVVSRESCIVSYMKCTGTHRSDSKRQQVHQRLKQL